MTDAETRELRPMAAETAVALKVHSAIAKALVDNGVTHMFGLIGDGNLYMADSFAREYGGTYVSAANEAGATIMALGYAMVSGKVGVATVTHGPAVTNTLTGLVEGVKGQVPMILLCGDTAVEDRDSLQNAPQRELIVATGAGFEQVRSPRTLSRDVATAMRRAVAERRPIALNVPIDFQWLDTEYTPEIARFPETRSAAASGEAFDNAIGIIAAARRPIVLAGRGALHPEARASILKLAERIGAPVATTLKAKDLFRGEPHNLGVFGTLSTPVAVDAITASDCVIAFGASLNRATTSRGTFLAGKRMVQVNAEAGELGKHEPPDAGLVGDPGLMAEAIVHWLDEAEIASSEWRDDALAERLAAYDASTDFNDMGTGTTVDVRTALARFNKAVPADRVVVTDGGRFMWIPYRLVDVADAKTFLFTLHFGAIGLGMPYAIGASYAAPGRPVLLVTGDGGFMLGGLVEFNTAVRHKVDLIVVLCNDGGYGAEHIQFRRKNMDPSMALFDWPEFAGVAEALGGRGVTVRSAGDLDAAVDAIAKRDRPLLIELKVDPDHMAEAIG